jgi:hypothetical protein
MTAHGAVCGFAWIWRNKKRKESTKVLAIERGFLYTVFEVEGNTHTRGTI